MNNERDWGGEREGGRKRASVYCAQNCAYDCRIHHGWNWFNDQYLRNLENIEMCTFSLMLYFCLQNMLMCNPVLKKNKLDLITVKNDKMWVSIFLSYIHCQVFIKNPVRTIYIAKYYMPYDIHHVIYLSPVKFSYGRQCNCDQGAHRTVVLKVSMQLLTL